MDEDKLEEWKLRLQSQIEYYFSDKNLVTDKYIRSKLNNEQQFPLIELVHFPKIEKLFEEAGREFTEEEKYSHLLMVDQSKQFISRVIPFNLESTVIPHRPECCIIIRNIAPEVTKYVLWALMVQAGPVAKISIPDPPLDKSRRVANCQFIHEVTAEYAFRLFNGIALYDVPLQIEMMRPIPCETGAALFLRNLPPSFVENNLYEICMPYGYITSVSIAREPTGESKCFGFVNFRLRSEADFAKKKLNELGACLVADLTERARRERGMNSPPKPPRSPPPPDNTTDK